MMTLRIRLRDGLDQGVTVGLAGLLLGTSLAFGGGVWWARTAIVGLTMAIVLAWLGRTAMAGPWRVLKSPMTALATLAIGLGVVQLLPIPAGIEARVSPLSLSVNSIGMIPEQGLLDDPAAELPAPFLARSPISLDRPSTLRWVVGAIACLGVFRGLVALLRPLSQGPGGLGLGGRRVLRQCRPGVGPGREPFEWALRDDHPGQRPRLGAEPRRRA